MSASADTYHVSQQSTRRCKSHSALSKVLSDDDDGADVKAVQQNADKKYVQVLDRRMPRKDMNPLQYFVVTSLFTENSTTDSNDKT